MDVDQLTEAHVPQCEAGLKPVVGRIFRTLDDANRFYDDYARVSGFDTRKFGRKTNGDVITWYYVVCSREGWKIADDQDAVNAREGFVNKRRRTSKRCGCKARISFKFSSDDHERCYIVHEFVEGHNHPLIEEEQKRFMSLNRSVGDLHRKFITDCAKASIGPTLTFKLLNELLGGYDGVGCTVVDVRNYARDMKAYVEGTDAQMLLDEMRRMKESCRGFTYAYEVDGEDKLKRIFWCDAVSKRNYHLFGDVVAFDTTYNTNRNEYKAAAACTCLYCMIFGPFTGKNNHGRPITFAAGLLSKEDADSFSWLFKEFVQCMGSSPRLIITDQDLGMKVAIDRVLVNTRHRWCMWHIMLKIADKVPKNLLSDEEFKKQLNSCVWSDLIEPQEFEATWKDIMENYGLSTVEWFKNMYANREYWVPAYFRDFAMGSVLRTTLVSESENSFFKRYSKHRSNLLEFIMNYNNALDQQRNESARLDYLDSTIVPMLATELSLEKHAVAIYTDSMFKSVQFEIVEACYKCRVVEMQSNDSMEQYSVIDSSCRTWLVTYDAANDTYTCGCKLFGRIGILCSHIFFVLKNKNVKLIPETYYGSRWLKSSIVKAVHGFLDDIPEGNFVNAEKRKAMNKLYSSFFGLVQRVEGSIQNIEILTTAIHEAGEKIYGESSVSSTVRKNKNIEKFYGARRPDAIDVHPPNVVKTKGSGSRLISRKEKAVRELNKPARRCAKCGEMGHHDARNCDKVRDKNRQKDLTGA